MRAIALFLPFFHVLEDENSCNFFHLISSPFDPLTCYAEFGVPMGNAVGAVPPPPAAAKAAATTAKTPSRLEQRESVVFDAPIARLVSIAENLEPKHFQIYYRPPLAQTDEVRPHTLTTRLSAISLTCTHLFIFLFPISSLSLLVLLSTTIRFLVSFAATASH